MANNKEIQGVLADNVTRLRLEHAPIESRTMNKFAKFCGIGNSALQALEDAKGDPQLGTLVKIAAKFKLEPWHLFVRGIDPAQKPHLLTSQEMAWHLKVEKLMDEKKSSGDPAARQDLTDTGSFAPPPNKRIARKFRGKRK